MIHDEMIPREAHVYPVHTGKRLLGLGSYQAVLKEISAIVKLDVAHEETCYRQLLEQYADFVQLLPHPLSSLKESMLSWSVKCLYHAKSSRDVTKSVMGVRPSYQIQGLDYYTGFFQLRYYLRLVVFAPKDALSYATLKDVTAPRQYFDKPMHHYGQYYKVRYGKGMSKRLTKEVTYLLANKSCHRLDLRGLVKTM